MHDVKLSLPAIALTLVALLAAPVASAQSSSKDFVVGSGPVFSRYGSNFVTPGSFITGGTLFDFTATSGALGESPSGRVDIVLVGELHGSAFAGPVTCLQVTGNSAVIGFRVVSSNTPDPPRGFIVNVVDGGPPGAGLDFLIAPSTSEAGLGDVVPTDCSLAPHPPFSDPRYTVTEGDIVVTDAPALPTSVGQCTHGGWRRFGFKSPGRCISFVVLTHVCKVLARHGHEPGFCPPRPPKIAG
jgi:hypothetical protein